MTVPTGAKRGRYSLATSPMFGTAAMRVAEITKSPRVCWFRDARPDYLGEK